MKKDAYYFSHDYNARNDFKCLFLRQQLGMEGYGIYWFLIESLAESGGFLPLKILPVLSMQMQVTETKVLGVINSFDLFSIDNDNFFSLRLNSHLDIRNTLSEAGKKGALKRWNNRVAIKDANNPPNAKERKESKESKENKEKSDFYNLSLNRLENLNIETYDKLKNDYGITEPIVYNHKNQHPITQYDLVEHLSLAIENVEWKQSLITRFGKNKKFSKAMVDYFNLLKTNYEYLEFKDTYDFRKYFANWFNTKKDNY